MNVKQAYVVEYEFVTDENWRWTDYEKRTTRAKDKPTARRIAKKLRLDQDVRNVKISPSGTMAMAL